MNKIIDKLILEEFSKQDLATLRSGLASKLNSNSDLFKDLEFELMHSSDDEKSDLVFDLIKRMNLEKDFSDISNNVNQKIQQNKNKVGEPIDVTPAT